MESKILLASLLMAVAFSSAFQTSQLVMPDKLSQQKERSLQDVQDLPANQQRTILDFLSALDEVQKNTKLKLLPKSTELQGYTKMFGKAIKKDGLSEGQPSPSFSQEDGVAESRKSSLKVHPLSMKSFRKVAPHSSKKSKKRACFWKYCVQRK